MFLFPTVAEVRTTLGRTVSLKSYLFCACFTSTVFNLEMYYQDTIFKVLLFSFKQCHFCYYILLEFSFLGGRRLVLHTASLHAHLLLLEMFQVMLHEDEHNCVLVGQRLV